MPLTLELLQELFGSRYRFERELGGGSMAAVYLAEDLRLGRAVAIKVLRPEYAATFAAERFLREIEIAARLQHPHIVPLLDSGEVAGNLYLVMPFIEGDSLRARLAREGRLPVGEVIRILADVADALAYAHRKGIVHRDIKPDNILLAGRHALVTDFGVAKAVTAAALAPRDLTIGVALGTPAYMAPEQATADPNVDHRCDLYALGVVGYELLAGAPPFEGPTPQAVLTAHVLDAPVPIQERRPEVPGPVAALIDRALAKRPDDRWVSADELLTQLEPLATPSGGTTPPSVPPVRPPPRYAPWIGGALIGVLGLAIAIRVAVPRGASNAVPVSAQQQLTFTGNTVAAALSPDGDLLAYVTSDSAGDHLRVQDQRSGAPITIAEGRSLSAPSWSASGAEIRYQLQADAGTMQLWSVPRLGGSRRLVSGVGGSTISPGGDWLARFPRGRNRLTFVNLGTGDSAAAEFQGFRWHSDPALTADGGRAAFAINAPNDHMYGLAIVARRDLRLQVVVHDTIPIGQPAWSPDATRLYYLRSRGGLSDLMRVEVDADGNARGNPEVIATGLGVEVAFTQQLDVGANGAQVVYTRREQWSNLALVSLNARAGAGEQRLLTMGSALYSSGQLSPDGRTIAYVRDHSSGMSLELQPVGGGVPRVLLQLPAVYGARWSPDGGHLVAVTSDSASGLGARVVSLDGGPDRVFRAPPPGTSPGWVSDSEIALNQEGNRGMWVINIRNGAAHPVPGVDSASWGFWPIGAPGGGALAFTRNLPGGKIGMYVAARGDSMPREILRGPYRPLRWSRDGHTIYAADFDPNADSVRLLSLPAAGGAATTIAIYPRHAEVLDVLPERGLVLLNARSDRGDAWAIALGSAARP